MFKLSCFQKLVGVEGWCGVGAGPFPSGGSVLCLLSATQTVTRDPMKPYGPFQPHGQPRHDAISAATSSGEREAGTLQKAALVSAAGGVSAAWQ